MALLPEPIMIFPYGGVSQQPPSLRLTTNCEIQDNCLATLVDGLTQRPPTEFVAVLESQAAASSYIFPIDKDQDNQYIGCITTDPEEPLEIFKIDGTKCLVRYGKLDDKGVFTEDNSVKNYITSANPKFDFKALTVTDHTFVINKTVVTSMSGVPDDAIAPTALIYVKYGEALQDYKVFVDDVEVASMTTPDTTDPSKYKTTAIAAHLYDDLVASLGTTDWNITNMGRTIYLSRKDGQDFKFYVRDSYNNLGLVGAKGTIQKFSDLPQTEVPEGFLIKVSGDPSNPLDGYYMRFETDSEHVTGTWKESLKDGLDNNFDASTMPHRIILTDIINGIPQFTVAPCNWFPRRCGDDEVNMEPSFIGNTINDIFFYQGRLCFLSGSSVIMSVTGDYFDLWRGTATKVLDDDPIDVSASAVKATNLRFAVPFNSTLLIFADNQQFTLANSGELTPSGVSFNPATFYETSKDCQPVAAGTNVYFIAPNGNYSRLMEYLVVPDTMINAAVNVTAHVPRYIPKNVFALESSSAYDIIFALSSETPNVIYVYKYYWQNNQKEQSAFCKFIFEDEILNMTIMGNYLYLITKCLTGEATPTTETVLVKMNLEKVYTGDLGFRIHADKLVKLRGIYDPLTNLTTWTLPYHDTSNNFVVVDSVYGNQIVTSVTHPTSNTMQAMGNYSAYDCYIGKTYVARYRFSEIYYKDTDGISDISGKLKLRRLTLSFTNTGNFKIEFTPYRRETFITPYTAAIIGEAIIGRPALKSGEHTFMTLGSNKGSTVDIVADTYLPMEIQSASFIVFYDPKGGFQ